MSLKKFPGKQTIFSHFATQKKHYPYHTGMDNISDAETVFATFNNNDLAPYDPLDKIIYERSQQLRSAVGDAKSSAEKFISFSQEAENARQSYQVALILLESFGLTHNDLTDLNVPLLHFPKPHRNNRSRGKRK